MRRCLSLFVLLLFFPFLRALPVQADDAAVPPSTVAIDLWYILNAHESNDAAYNASFGAGAITGRVNGAIVLNGQPHVNQKYATVKFFKSLTGLAGDQASKCIQRAVTVAGIQQTIDVGPSSGRNAQLVMKITGEITLNEGNGGFEGEPNLTIVEVRSLKTIACEATVYMPSIP